MDTTVRAQEHEVVLQGTPLQMKLIAEAVRFYFNETGMGNQTLEDAIFTLESEYQRVNNLDQDDWDFTEDDKEELSILV